MKKFFLIFFLINLLIIFALSIYWMPNAFYYRIIKGGYNPKWYRKNPESYRVLTGRKSIELIQSTKSDDKFWKLFHIGNYRIPLPKEHPLYLIDPVVNYDEEEDNVLLGLQFFTQKQELIVAVTFNPNRRFVQFFKTQELFEIPILEGLLEGGTTSKLWKDLFSKDLDVDLELKKFKVNNPKVGDEFGLRYWYTLWSYRLKVWSGLLSLSFQDMIYNLHLWDMREKYLPKNSTAFSFDETKNAGIIEVPAEDSDFKEHLVFYLQDGFMESYTIRMLADHHYAKEVANRLFETIYFSPSSKEISHTIYKQFRDLSYRDKIKQEGMFYLFSAWSHDIENKEFLRDVIQFLERGRDNTTRLGSLYYYAYKKYGTNFSAKRKKQSAEVKLEEKINEHIEKESQEAENATLKEGEVKFKTKEEKIMYYLHEAKRKNKEGKKQFEETIIFD